MSDWEFLHEMRDRGYSAEDIADAAACGYAPWESEYLDRGWIDSQLEGEPRDGPDSVGGVQPFQSRAGFPFSVLEQTQIFLDLIECAERHLENTGRYLQIWGELGEIYAEIKFGLRRHGTHEPGSDGTIRGKRVEVKTLSPERKSDRVLVKSQGDFEQLLVVRIDREFNFTARLFDRSELKVLSGRLLSGRFGAVPSA